MNQENIKKEEVGTVNESMAFEVPTKKDVKAMTFVLGAQDPEMREIGRVLDAHNLRHIHAAVTHSRCNAGNAYDADSVVVLEMSGRQKRVLLTPNDPVALVECALKSFSPTVRMDHHNPGDPGFSYGAKDYLKGSSLGQVMSFLDHEPTETQRLLAAADHCLTAAYQGECEGVDPGELLFLRAAWQAKMSGRTLSEVMDGIMNAGKAIKKRFNKDEGWSYFEDPTRSPRDLPEGSAYAGIAVVYRAMMEGGGLKEMIKGGNAEQITRFMERHEEKGRKVYGNPNRGYAGAYVELGRLGYGAPKV